MVMRFKMISYSGDVTLTGCYDVIMTKYDDDVTVAEYRGVK